MRIKLAHANIGDSEEIATLAQELKLNPERPQQNGFLFYPYTSDQYDARMGVSDTDSGDTFIVARDDKGKLAGFISAWSREALRAIYSPGLGAQTSVVYYFLGKSKDFVFGEQIGVRRDLAGKGLGSLLLNQMMRHTELAGIEDVYVSILDQPFRNEASAKFCEEFGFRSTGQAIRNSDNSLWGIYYASSHVDLEERR